VKIKNKVRKFKEVENRLIHDADSGVSQDFITQKKRKIQTKHVLYVNKSAVQPPLPWCSYYLLNVFEDVELKLTIFEGVNADVRVF